VPDLGKMQKAKKAKKYNNEEEKVMAETVALIVAGGSGKRTCSKTPKQYVDINGYPLLYYTIVAFQESGVDEIVIVADKDHIEFCEDMELQYGLSKIHGVVEGGSERHFSVLNGLRYIKKEIKPGMVLIHDGARPYIQSDVINEIIDATEEYGAAIAAMPVKDTIKVASHDGFVLGTTDRETTWQAQTPQGFDFDLIYEAYEQIVGNLDENESFGGVQGVVKFEELEETDDNDLDESAPTMEEMEMDDEEYLNSMPKITDDAMVYQMAFGGKRVKLVEAGYDNIKITTADDLDCAECLLGE